METPKSKTIKVIQDIKDFEESALSELSNGKGDDFDEQQSFGELHQNFSEQDESKKS